MSNDSNDLGNLPVLEGPPGSESPTANLGLLGDDSFAVSVAKLTVVETLLSLLTRDCSFTDFMRDLLLSVMKVVKSEAGSVLEVDHKNSVLFFRAVVGQSSDHITRFTVPIGKGVVGHVAETRQPLVVQNAADNELHLKSIQTAVNFEVRNLVAVPILIRGQVFGVLELLNRLGDEGYTNADVELLTYLCEMIAKGIEARLMIAWGVKHALKTQGIAPEVTTMNPRLKKGDAA